jgi:hypothetical protein
MLLLAATANLVSFSYDADDDDDTPPVDVELNIVTSTKRPAHLVKQHSSTCVAHVECEKPPLDQKTSAGFEPASLLDKSSPQLVIPLRT